MENYLIPIIVLILLLVLLSGVLGPGEALLGQTADAIPAQPIVIPTQTVEAPVQTINAPVQTINAVPAIKTGKYMKCETEPVTFTECPNGITSGTIKYGRWDNTICPHGTVNQSTPPIFKEYPLAAGTKEIAGYINDYVKDDPYYGVSKHYEASYVC